MEKVVILEIGNKKFSKEINFELSFKLTKFRNKLSYGIDFTEAEKPIVEEIIKIQEKVRKTGELDSKDISPETLKYLNKMSNKKADVFDYDELIEMGLILTGIEEKEKLLKLYDKEVLENGYDELIAKLTFAMSSVFLNAKNPSETETKN